MHDELSHLRIFQNWTLVRQILYLPASFAWLRKQTVDCERWSEITLYMKSFVLFLIQSCSICCLISKIWYRFTSNKCWNVFKLIWLILLLRHTTAYIGPNCFLSIKIRKLQLVICLSLSSFPTPRLQNIGNYGPIHSTFKKLRSLGLPNKRPIRRQERCFWRNIPGNILMLINSDEYGRNYSGRPPPLCERCV